MLISPTFLSFKMSFLLTPLRWNHYAACRDVFEESFDISEHASFPTEWRSRCEKRSVVALYRGIVVGFALVDTAHKIQYINIRPDFQNAKLGSKLLAYVLRACADDRSIWLVTADDMRLVKWYGRHGFQITHTYKDDDGEFMGADMVRRQRCRSQTKGTR